MSKFRACQACREAWVHALNAVGAQQRQQLGAIAQAAQAEGTELFTSAPWASTAYDTARSLTLISRLSGFRSPCTMPLLHMQAKQLRGQSSMLETWHHTLDCLWKLQQNCASPAKLLLRQPFGRPSQPFAHSQAAFFSPPTQNPACLCTYLCRCSTPAWRRANGMFGVQLAA